MSKWETQGRINSITLCQVSKIIFLLFCGFIGTELLLASQLKGKQWPRENLTRRVKSNLSSSTMMDICWLIPNGLFTLFTWENQTFASEDPRASEEMLWDQHAVGDACPALYIKPWVAAKPTAPYSTLEGSMFGWVIKSFGQKPFSSEYRTTKFPYFPTF